ncbi:GTP cyclohydrolase I FolE [Nanchangia anserum]|uniref:GTP cyclohydrolase 1 n=1 Tax=Nanchangia anserum TaxID=2692125 RepID=A0A8I0KNN3_9ACTO|nr:GTP cyclohydrolase I FolE [Nanchangia anserum]MBD3689466.1 GTP cyclohydrolase I FolE [Nanchangia anserum]QOX81662.1 GTP cyclohydrolase I FolE [Nanchangia anserum]
MYDADGVRRAVRDLLVAVGEDPDRDGLAGTPDRMARAYREILSGAEADPSQALATTFDLGHDEMVLVRDIPFYSLCEHHMLPFFGTAAVAYVPSDGRVTGLSKLARVVDGYARRLQVQERLTSQVADAVDERLAPRGVAVVCEAEHLCMTMRGIQKPGSRTITSALRGLMRSDERTRGEVMSLILGARQ